MELLSIDQVKARVGLSAAAIYANMRAGKFPKQARIGGHARWSKAEVEDWIKAQFDARPGAKGAP